MAEARSMAAWAHTSSLWALFMDIHRDPKTPARFKLADFNPHMKGGGTKPKPLKMVSMAELREMMPDLPGAMKGGR